MRASQSDISVLNSPTTECRMNLLSPSHPVIYFVEKDCMCGRFLSVASLQGLIHEGTMTSLCMAMTEEQQKSVIIDCSSSQPQFHNAGEPQPWEQPCQSLFSHGQQMTQSYPPCPVQFYMFIPKSPKTRAFLETWKS